MTDAGGQDRKAVWTQVVDRVKRDVIAPSLWRALEKTVAIAWEGNNFVIGLAASDGQLAGQLNSGEYRGAIERALQAVTADRNLVLRVIEGTEQADWEHAKARDAAATAQREAASQRRFIEAGTYASWDEVYDQIARLWSGYEFRALSTGRGRFISQAMDLAIKAMDALYPKEGKPEEQTERGLARVIERIASIAQSDAAVIGFLLFERWNQRKGA